MSVAHILKAASITAEMTERRDFVRQLLGDWYEPRVADIKLIVRWVAERDGISVVAAGLKICQQAVRDGHGSAVNMVIAATVDLADAGPIPEPKDAKPTA